MKPEYLNAMSSQANWLRWSITGRGEAMWRSRAELPSFIKHTHQKVSEEKQLRGMYEDVLRGGELIYVGREFCGLLDAAVPALPNSTFRMDLLPSRHGFVWFEEEMLLGDTKALPGVPLHIKAMGWLTFRDDRTGKDAVQVMVFVREHTGGFFPMSYFGIEEGDRLDDRIAELETYTEGDAESASYIDQSRHEMRHLMGLLLLMDQRLLAQRRHHMDRASRRRAERDGLKVYDHIQVIVYRRFMDQPDGYQPSGEPGNYSVRWVVRGHWRNQWYPRLGLHQPVWIGSYDKGPEGAPMSRGSSQRVFSVTR